MTHDLVPCPRCHAPLRVFRHVCNRFVCSGPDCPEWEPGDHASPSACEYPNGQGHAAAIAKLPRQKEGGTTIWSHGHWASPEIEQVYKQPIEPLPAPYNARRVDSRQQRYDDWVARLDDEMRRESN